MHYQTENVCLAGEVCDRQSDHKTWSAEIVNSIIMIIWCTKGVQQVPVSMLLSLAVARQVSTTYTAWANTLRSPGACLMLGHCLRRWSNIKPALSVRPGYARIYRMGIVACRGTASHPWWVPNGRTDRRTPTSEKKQPTSLENNDANQLIGI